MPDPATPEPPRPGTPVPRALDAVAVRRVWGEVVGKVNRSNKRIAALMRDAVVRDLDGDTLVLTVKSPVLAQMMSSHAQVLTDALYEELGGRWQIRCDVAGERGATPLAGPRAAAPASAAPVPASAARPAPEPAGPGPVTPAAPRTGGAPAPRGGPADPAVPAAGEADDWPEPARPGGIASANDSADWPEPARPGGDGPIPVVAAAPPTAGAPTAGVQASAKPAAAPVNGGTGGGPVSSGLAAARAAAAGRAPRTQAPAPKTADTEWAGEPPYDPDYDGPVREAVTVPAYEGFDPGDEPLDEVIDERTARQSSEEQAVRLLREALGAEKIDEVDAR